MFASPYIHFHIYSSIQHPTDNRQQTTDNIQHPTSNIQHTTSNIHTLTTHPQEFVQRSVDTVRGIRDIIRSSGDTNNIGGESCDVIPLQPHWSWEWREGKKPITAYLLYNNTQRVLVDVVVVGKDISTWSNDDNVIWMRDWIPKYFTVCIL